MTKLAVAVDGSIVVSGGKKDAPMARDKAVAPEGASAAGLAWLRQSKVTAPERVPGYLEREDLMSRAKPTNQPLTLLQAPGGFGKTTLLAECCRQLVESGVPVAWVSVDEQDAPQVLDTYLVFAFEQAGVDIVGLLRPGELGAGSTHRRRTDSLLNAIEAHRTPCVLVLDELERLVDSGSVSLLNFVLRWRPSNLHIAIACRELPRGLDVGEAVLAGSALVLSADELRFSKPEIARFFGLKLSRREHRALTADSQGWPIALRIRRNELRHRRDAKDRATGEAGVVREVVDNWIEARLWYGLAAEDREFVLDIGLCEWMDAELLDEVFEGTDAMRRIESMRVLVGLLEPVGPKEPVAWRLHPLIREHCVKQRFRETPDRYHAIHRRIATALSRRGETVSAMRHAADAGDSVLVGDILVQAGGLRLWLRDGLVRLQAADRFLTAAMIAHDPRLALVRCAVLALTGRVAQARRLYSETGPLGFSPDAPGDDLELRLDHILIRGLLVVFGCEGFGSEQARAPFVDARAAVETRGIEPLVRGTLEFGVCVAHNLRAEFDAALSRAERARAYLGQRSSYVTMHVNFQVGTIAMARGQVGEAARWYARAERVAKTNFLRDPSVVTQAEVLIKELDLERHRIKQVGAALQVAKALGHVSTPFVAYTAASAVVAELSLHVGGVDAALAALDEIREHAYREELPALSRYLTALRVGTLVGAGRIDEAERNWQRDGLPDDHAGCLDLSRQTWREMEALCCARLRLLIAREQYDEARDFATEIMSVTAERGLRRTWMRALALRMSLEHHAGDGTAAVQWLEKFLHVYEETDYLRPLVRERQASVAVITQYLGKELESAARTSAEEVLSSLTRGERNVGGPPELTEREADVLSRLEEQRDKEIAAALDLTPSGVRYHVTNILAKLGARGRIDAVHRARGLGLLP